MVDSNLAFYDSIKPKVSARKYTVIATLNDCKSHQLLALATGTQAGLRVYSDDIEDCHAESLVKRAYKRYLINKLKYNISSTASLDAADDCSTGLILSVSQFPCGLLSRYLGDEPIDETTGDIIKRKPGRGQLVDGKVVYVQRDKCIDKLKRWISQGMQGRQLTARLGLISHIKKILIGDCECQSDLDYLTALIELTVYLGLTKEQVYFVGGVRRQEFVYSPDCSPQPEAIVWWRQLEPLGSNRKQMEIIVDGRRKGLTKHQAVDSGDKASYKLQVGDFCLRRDLDSVIAQVTGQQVDSL